MTLILEDFNDIRVSPSTSLDLITWSICGIGGEQPCDRLMSFSPTKNPLNIEVIPESDSCLLGKTADDKRIWLTDVLK